MWNRVVLLTAGVAFGWSLVTWFSTVEERIRRTQVNVALAALAGLGVILWLGSENTSAAFMGTFVYALGAVGAYAAHAKQILRPPEPAPAPPLARSVPEPAERLAILVAPAPPPTYSTGSIARMLAHGKLPPRLSQHWLLAPAAYRRLRRAYNQHGPLPYIKTLLETLTGLQERLGEGWRVELAHLDDEPTLEQRLLTWQDQGYRSLVLLPVDAREDELAEIASVTRHLAGNDLAGTRVAPVVRLLPADIYQDTLHSLVTGTQPPPCPILDPTAIDRLARSAESSTP